MGSLSVEDVYKGQPASPQAQSGSVSASDVYSNLPDDHPHKDQSLASNINRMMADTENKRLAGEQFIKPDVEGHAPGYLGKAYHTDSGGDAIYYDDEKGQPQETDKKKHVVLRDPDDGKLKVYKRNPDLEYGPIMGRILGLGRIFQEGLATNSPPVNKVAGVAANTLKAVDAVKDTTGVDVAVPKLATTESGLVQGTGQVLSRIPGGSGPFKAAAGGMADDLGEATGAAAALPTRIAANPQVVGEATRGDVKAAVKSGGALAQKVEDAYSKVTGYLKPDAKGELSNTLGAAQKITQEYSESGRSGFTNAIREVLEPLTTPGGLSYGGLRRLTSDIGEMIGGNRELPAGMEVGDLKRIYGGLKEDMKALVAQSGKRASAALEKANGVANVVARDREKLLTIFGSETKSDEAIFSRLASAAGTNSRADARLLGLVKRNVSEFSWNTLSSGVIGQLGKVVSKEGEHFDPGKFLKDYDTLSDRGKNLLFGTDTKLRTALDSIYQISTRWGAATRTTKETSDIAHIAAGFGIFHGLTEKPLELLAAATGVRFAAKQLANPITAESVAKWSARYEALRLKPGSGTIALFNNATNVLSHDIMREAAGDVTSKTMSAAGDLMSSPIKTVEKLATSIKERVFGSGKDEARQ